MSRSDHGDDDLVAGLVHRLELPPVPASHCRRRRSPRPAVALVQQDLAPTRRPSGHQQDDDQHDDRDPRAAPGALVAVLGLPGVAGGLEHDRAGDEDRGGVGEEEDEGAEAPGPNSPAPSVMPTTASTGTSEMAMATPARMSAMSRRDRANEPAMPTATATVRSSSVGAVRPTICGFTSIGMRLTVTSPMSTPMRMFTAMPPTRSAQRAAQGVALARSRPPAPARRWACRAAR